jgi:ribosomal protein S18 acetylase RimI-like enzyme
VIGFVCVWARVPPEDPAEDPSPYAFVSDLVVRAEHRGSGWGRRLLDEAERYARSKGLARIKVGVLARNRIARRLYSRSGFEDYHLQLQKRL